MGRCLVHLLSLRQAGSWSNNRFKKTILGAQLRSLKISEGLEFNQESHTAAVSSLSLDRLDEQYILAGFGDGTISIHDVNGERTDTGYKSKVELRIGRSNIYAHSRAVETVCWYVDNGMFLSSGRDGKLQVWDSDRGIVVEEFSVGEPINKHCIGEPEVGALVAVAARTNHLQLVDLRTGSTCHTLGSRTLGGHSLQGHSGEVNCCAWSRADPWVLASGSADKKIMLWDVRCRGSIDLVSVEDGVKDLLFVPENSKIAVFDAGSGCKLSSLDGHLYNVNCLDLGRAKVQLYSGGRDRFILQWDTPLQIAAARASKEEHREERKDINPYTVDTWTSDEDEDEDG